MRPYWVVMIHRRKPSTQTRQCCCPFSCFGLNLVILFVEEMTQSFTAAPSTSELLRTTAGRHPSACGPTVLGGRDSLPQALDSDAALLLPVFVLRFSPEAILFVEEMTQSFTAAPSYQ